MKSITYRKPKDNNFFILKNKFLKKNTISIDKTTKTLKHKRDPQKIIEELKPHQQVNLENVFKRGGGKLGGHPFIPGASFLKRDIRRSRYQICPHRSRRVGPWCLEPMDHCVHQPHSLQECRGSHSFYLLPSNFLDSFLPSSCYYM